MSLVLNPMVKEFVPRSLEPATKALCPQTLTHPLPAKPLFSPSLRHRRQPRASETVLATSKSEFHQRLGDRQIIGPPQTPSMTLLPPKRKCNSSRRKRQRKGKESPSNNISCPQKANYCNHPVHKSSSKLVHDSSMPEPSLGVSNNQKKPSSYSKKILINTKEIGCRISPFLPQQSNDYMLHRKEKKQEHKRMNWRNDYFRVIESKPPKVENSGKSCMGGKVFGTNHSAVLAIRTIWCPDNWKDQQKQARWPLPCEFYTDGPDRRKGGFGSFLPVPRSEQFEWRLATSTWRNDPIGTRYPVWDCKAEIPVLERRFAATRGVLDCIVGWGRVMDAEFLFDRAEETTWEEGIKIIGRALWEEL